MMVEDKLAAMDFSKFSNVKDSLKEQLLQRMEDELSMDELDMVAAARGSVIREFHTEK